MIDQNKIAAAADSEGGRNRAMSGTDGNPCEVLPGNGKGQLLLIAPEVKVPPSPSTKQDPKRV